MLPARGRLVVVARDRAGADQLQRLPRTRPFPRRFLFRGWPRDARGYSARCSTDPTRRGAAGFAAISCVAAGFDAENIGDLQACGR